MKFLIVFTIALALSYANIVDERSIDKLMHNQFGATVLEAIQIELKMGVDRMKGGPSPLERVTALLDTMRFDLIQDQSQADEQRTKEHQPCLVHITEAQTLLTLASQKQADDEGRMPLLLEQQRDKQRQANDKVGQDTRNHVRIHELTVERTESHAQFITRRDEINGLVSTLQEAARIVGQLKSGTSFLQTTDGVFSELKKHEAKFIKNYPTKQGFHGLVSILMEIAQDVGVQANQNGVQRILTVIDELVDSLFQLNHQEQMAENHRQQQFTNQTQRLYLENTRLEGTIATMRANVEVITQTLLELSNDIATNVEIGNAKGAQVRDWTMTCNDKQREYETQTDNRNEKLDIINQVLALFTAHLAEIAPYLQGAKF